MLCLLSSLLVASSLVFNASCCAGFKRSSSVIGRLETVRTIGGQSSGEVEVLESDVKAVKSPSASGIRLLPHQKPSNLVPSITTTWLGASEEHFHHLQHNKPAHLLHKPAKMVKPITGVRGSSCSAS